MSGGETVKRLNALSVDLRGLTAARSTLPAVRSDPRSFSFSLPRGCTPTPPAPAIPVRPSVAISADRAGTFFNLSSQKSVRVAGTLNR